MRKFCMITMSFLLFMTQITYGETEFVESSEVLRGYGIVTGYENGDLKLDESLKRAEACVLLSSLYGVKAKAMDTPYTPYFSDVEEDAWYAPYISFAKENGWISGYGDGTFKPNDEITKMEWASMLMTGLLYPVTWEDIESEASALNLLPETGENNEQITAEVIFRGEAFEMLYRALHTLVNGSKIMLGQELGYFSELNEIAINTSSEPLEVIGYMTPSLRMIKIKFNQKIANVVLPENVHLYDENNEGIVISEVTLSETFDEISLYLETPAETYDKFMLTLDPLILLDGSQTDEMTLTEIEMIDIEGPEVISIYRLDTENQIEINFSEPVKTVQIEDLFISDESVKVKAVAMVHCDESCIVSFEDVLLDELSLTVSSNIEDDYGHHLINGQTYRVYSDMSQNIQTEENADSEIPIETNSVIPIIVQ